MLEIDSTLTATFSLLGFHMHRNKPHCDESRAADDHPHPVFDAASFLLLSTSLEHLLEDFAASELSKELVSA